MLDFILISPFRDAAMERPMPRSILLADDSVTIQKVVELTFIDDDYEVEAVSDGAAAIARLAHGRPDLLIADVHMPGLDGYEVCRQARARYPDLPILLLVGTFEPFDPDTAADCGANAHVIKPFDSPDLHDQVEALIEAAKAPGSAEPPALPDIGLDADLGVDLGRVTDPDLASPPESPSAQVFEVAPGTEANATDPTVELSTLEPLRASQRASPFATALHQTPFPELDATEIATPEPLAPAAAASFETTYAEHLDEVVPAAKDAQEAPGEDSVPTQELAVEFELGAASAAPAPTPAPTPAPVAEAADAPPPRADAALEAAGNGNGLGEADVERIARRVVELLGSQTVREVAWEVVPDLAEVVIKERLRELESQVE